MFYQVRLSKFEGPLDLLLELIEKERMDITDISLAKVANDYLLYLDNTKNIKPSVLVDFLYIAAHLILMKSKSLLPDLSFEEEEELSVDELKKRLIEYKRFKEAGKKIGEIYKNGYKSFEQKFCLEKVEIFYPGRTLNMASFLRAANRIVCEIAKFEKLEEETIQNKISIKEKINLIKNLITKKLNIKFSNILVKSKDKTEAIVSFLALLELVKRRLLQAEQKELFGDIMVATSVRCR